MVNSSQKKSSLHIDLIVTDTISLIFSFVASYVIKFGDLSFVSSENWTMLLYIVILLNIVIGFFSNPYGNFFKRPYYEETVNALLLTFYNLFTSAVILYVLKIGPVFSRQMILTMYAMYFVLSAILKCIWKKLVLSGKIKFYIPEKQNLFIICDAEKLRNTVHNANAGDFEMYNFKGIGIIGTTKLKEYKSIPIIYNSDKFINYIIENNINEILIATNGYNLKTEDFAKLIKNNIGIHFGIDSLIGHQTEDYDISDVGIIKTLTMGNYAFTSGQRAYLFVKRIVDVLVGIIGVIVLIPVSAIIKLAYLLHKDTSKIIYKQERIGKNGKTIKIYKFRTMVLDADLQLTELLKDEKYRKEWELNQKIKNDPRITKVGAFLRKSSIDELPQLINVLKGEMSLVGPRPLVKNELEAHNGLKLYNLVSPGITGWWGCNGRSNIDYTERLELEYYYIKNISVYLDFLCILRTFLTVLKKDGAE